MEASEPGELSIGFVYSRLDVDFGIELAGFAPELGGFCVFAGGGFEQRKPAKGVGQVEGLCLGVGAINIERFDVAGCAPVKLILMAENVRGVTDGVGQFERVAEGAVEGGGLLVKCEGCIEVVEVALDLCEGGEGASQNHGAGSARKIDGFRKESARVCQAMVASRLIALGE